MFAMMANRYFDKYGIDSEEGKKILAEISVKSHRNGALNPKAHLRREVTAEQVIKAPIIAWPLGLFDCCGVSDEAAAIVTTPEIAKKLSSTPVYVKALQVAVSSGEELMYSGSKWDGTYVESTYRAGMKAYQEAGIKNPRQELSLLEVHDCFSITELTIYEDLQISSRGRAKEDIEAGFYNLDGEIPCQPDGGLKCFGHPIGASGLRMIYEVYKQLQGKAGARQIKNPKLGLTHNMGGFPVINVVSIAIFGN
jgi:acetyl-CoA C-acetyltransferase